MLLFCVCLHFVNAQNIKIVNELEFKLDQECPLVFYEGQRITIPYTIRNLSPNQRNYEIFPSTQLTHVVDFSDNTELKPRSLLTHYDISNKNIENRNAVNPMPGNYRGTLFLDLGYDIIGNYTISNYLPEIKSSSHYPLFLKPGKYKAFISIQLIPGNSTLGMEFTFEVKKAEGEVRTRLIEYLKAIKSDLNESSFEDPKPLNQLKLYKIASDGKNNPYSSDAFRLLSIEYNIGTSSIINLRHNSDNMFQLFKLIPALDDCQSRDMVQTFLVFKLKFLKEFKNEGKIVNLKSFLDEYLKKIEHLWSAHSALIIQVAEKDHKIYGLVNYSAQRQIKLK
jgi:hypothetical protein